MAYATISDVEVLLQRTLTAEESAAVQARLNWLTARINIRLPGLAAAAAASVNLAVLAGGVVASAATRVLSGASSSTSDRVTSETVGGITLRYGEWSSTSGEGAPGMDLTDGEWDLLAGLLPSSGSVTSGAFTIRPSGSPDAPTAGRHGCPW